MLHAHIFIKRLMPWLRALVATAILAVALEAAAPAAIELRGDAGAAGTGDIVANRAAVDITMRLDNDSTARVTVTLVPRPVRRTGGVACDASAGCSLALSLVEPMGSATSVPFDRQTSVSIPELGSRELRLKGTLEGLGRYVVDILVYEAGQQAPAPKSIAITRALQVMPAEALQVGPGGQLIRRILTDIDPIPIRIANASNEPFSLDRVALTLTGVDAGGSSTRPVAFPAGDEHCFAKVDKTTGTGQPLRQQVQVKPGTDWTCPVRLAGVDAGHYQLRVEPSGPGLKWTAATFDVRVRDAGLGALIALLGGAIIGAVVGSWTQGGRERLTLAIAAQDQIDAFRQFEETMPTMGPDSLAASKHWREKLETVLETLRKGGDGALTLGDRIDGIAATLPVLIRFEALERQAQPFMGSVQAAYGAAVAALTAADPDAVAAKAAVDALAAAISQAKVAARAAGAAVGAESQLFVFGWARGLSELALRARLRRYDVIVQLFSIAVACALGMLTLWSPDPTWGSLGDYVVALLTGLTFTIGGTVTLQALAQNYPLGRLAR